MLRGVSKTYGDRASGVNVEALRDVDLEVGAGEFVSVVGPSGCGKSTLLSLIAGLDRPGSGRILVHGRRVDGTPGLAGYMPQRDLLLPWRSVLDNVILGPELQGVPRAEARREAVRLFPRFGLDGFERSDPRALSGGMRQRAALLRTILPHRDTLLLDEPFGALDALTRSEMQEWLLSIWREFGKNVLFVTHDVEEAVFLSDRVYVMSRRPGTMKLEVATGLPRPRTRAMLVEPALVRAKQTLLDSLLEEASAKPA